MIRNRSQPGPKGLAAVVPLFLGIIAVSGCNTLAPVPLTSLPEVPSMPALTPERAAWKALDAGDLERSRELFTRQTEAHPKKPAGHYGLGRVALARGDRETAITHLTRAAELDGESADAWAYLGTAQLQLERNDEAHASLERALSLEPGNGQALVAMAEYAAHVEVDYDKALRHLELAKASGFAAIPPELEPSLRQNLN